MDKLDELDRKILNALQADAAISLDQLGETIGLSRNACWRRVIGDGNIRCYYQTRGAD